ncbi:hypothetical protein H0H10_36810 [Streptomyces sp. TRM S81-3]|uniref:Uncharacterized protein n=1 Tax=Streptomyces griseicoloratus TaxID=2752516 RepID=A0A926LAQ9_9ACTN|nr:hypothetical protein [Streptomyces griseicoloratus]MBD0424666.1 hypothetical protein [Streptomyces griseicoloratus]
MPLQHAGLLPEPYETDLGAELTHHLPATAHPDVACPSSGHSIGWTACYDGADTLPLTHKAWGGVGN